MKLGHLTVLVEDKSSTPIPGVLISLSGDSYRSNNVTQLNGSFVFSNLLPGQYFVRPFLKEYIFDPSSKEIVIAEGSDTKFSFSAKRIAFSCYGSFTSLNGEPEKFVPVEAVGPQGEYEETQSDINGQFRLRGLIPNIPYEVRIKDGEVANDRVERAAPKSVFVTVTNDNIHNVSFVVFRRSQRYSIMGVVQADAKWLHTSALDVRLYKDDTNEGPIKTIVLGPSNFFEFSSLLKGRYVVRVGNSLSSEVYSISTVDKNLELQTPITYVQLSFNATVHNREITELTSTPIVALVFGIFALVLIFYYQSIIELIQSFGKSEVIVEQSWLPKELQKKTKRRN
jgi:hypothetical protein